MKEIQYRSLEQLNHFEEDEAKYLEGLIPYGKRSHRLPFYEYVERTAFNKSLADKFDVKCLYNHDYSNILGRVANGSLVLTNADDGLHVRVKLPNTRQAEDVWNLVHDGYVSQMSFGFTVVKQDVGFEDNIETHYLREVKLYEVSFVPEPAYPDTKASARSIFQEVEDMPKEDLQKLKERIDSMIVENHESVEEEKVENIQDEEIQEKPADETVEKVEDTPAVQENTEVVDAEQQKNQQLLKDILNELKMMIK